MAEDRIVVSNSGYHVGHQISIRVAEEQGFFSQEGFAGYVYEPAGLIPGPLEREGLALAMKEHGVSIATAVNVQSAVYQRSRGADLFIVGGWRYMPHRKLVAMPGVETLVALAGHRLGMREPGGLDHRWVASALRKAGLSPESDIEWVFDPCFAYGYEPESMRRLHSGDVDAICCLPHEGDRLEREGLRVLLDTRTLGARPGRVIVATGQTIEEHGADLRAFFRGLIRAVWFVRGVSNFDYLADLEARLRRETNNEDEKAVRIITSPFDLESWVMPIDGGVSRPGLEAVIEEMMAFGEIDRPVGVDEVLREGAVVDAYETLCRRPELQAGLRNAQSAVETHGL